MKNQIYVQVQDLQKGDMWGHRTVDRVALFEGEIICFIYFADEIKPNPETMSKYDEIMVGREEVNDE